MSKRAFDKIAAAQKALSELKDIPWGDAEPAKVHLFCSFCGRNNDDIEGYLLTAPAANICSSCVADCVSFITEANEGKSRKCTP